MQKEWGDNLLPGWIHGAMHVEEKEEYHSDHGNRYTHADTCTRSRVITYFLDSSSRIHEAMHVEEMVEHHSNHRDRYTPCRHMHNG